MYADHKTSYRVWILCCPIACTQAEALSTKAGQPLILPRGAHHSLHVDPHAGVMMDMRFIPKNMSGVFLTSLTKLVKKTNFTIGLIAVTSPMMVNICVKLRKQTPNDVSFKRESMLVPVLIFHYQLLINPINISPSLLDWLPCWGGFLKDTVLIITFTVLFIHC